ncbi:23S rRNA pseudouridine1911/1915/1917 synthase [Bathymodiolus platifrons methanotrophic gill symbiont]|uniref:23S rRNA pseudouridine(1911/1915/1917) synthase RluD n=1 Tax=Bathymodiolus platifrons methanotrophic gill symbiont TaxID=113268 RepID=UPI000B41F472|nr:23S rRNA pseudouridine(1911/1915/1917) synthase RluD [Bathymodiolus platifrons methanotrophic gill symbiont]MCK5869456.1 23S rRNA pseudouridine(1911/1915/1917) synthase RluD [Methyloprofundus sp.]TXK97827.1 23S rRNA pseudouridine(1911/1915/1917) synthase [Methylococcaceae bacterium CS4]TXL00379.1 23S rRNA pseudouridine(1911/1915/1917) synthase [Methylococcaceae bacterium CS5]TXL07508.1 23S rRNA pseudouridine(1911/1915/1917) synthase [Methylococcaceae bacterium CS3]TXL08075.1 23S rRNA pseudo
MAILTAEVPLELAGKRLDQVLVEIFPDYSRNKLQSWIKAGRVTVNAEQLKAKDRLVGGEALILDAEAEEVTEYLAEDIPLDIIYEDDDILIVNKPAGLVVHPGAGNWTGTLQNALLFYLPEAVTIPRSGIVHRIDKDTSGLLMVAKTLAAHHSLVEQLQAREIHREYLAITIGRMTGGGTIDEPLGRHPTDRKKFAVRDAGKPAITHYRVLERFLRNTLIQVKLETGRTHQIRVHMAHMRMPLVGDPMYSGRFQMPKDCGDELEKVLRNFKRQALHAEKLGLIHPRTGEYCEWQLPVPDDMQELLAVLRTNDTLDHS